MTALTPSKFCQQQAAPAILDDDVADLNDPTQHDVLWDAPMTPAEAQALEADVADLNDPTQHDDSWDADFSNDPPVLEKSETVDLGSAEFVVDTWSDHVDLTFRAGDRTVFGFQLSHREAEALGMNLARPHGITMTDLFAVADEFGMDASRIVAGGKR